MSALPNGAGPQAQFPLQCAVCEKAFHAPRQLTRHVLAKHIKAWEDAAPDLRCTVAGCDYVAPSFQSLASHMQGHLPGREVTVAGVTTTNRQSKAFRDAVNRRFEEFAEGYKTGPDGAYYCEDGHPKARFSSLWSLKTHLAQKHPQISERFRINKVYGQPKAKAQAQPKAKAQAQPKANAQAQPKAKVQARPKAQAAAGPKAKAKAKANAKPRAKPKARPRAQ